MDEINEIGGYLMDIGFIFWCLAICTYSRRFFYIHFGKQTKGKIVGTWPRSGSYRMPIGGQYMVQYEYNGKKYLARALEGPSLRWNKLYLYNEVTIYFRKGKPERVAILEIKYDSKMALGFFILGLISNIWGFCII